MVAEDAMARTAARTPSAPSLASVFAIAVMNKVVTAELPAAGGL